MVPASAERALPRLPEARRSGRTFPAGSDPGIIWHVGFEGLGRGEGLGREPPQDGIHVPTFWGRASHPVHELRSRLFAGRRRRSRIDPTHRNRLGQQTNGFDGGGVHQYRLSRVPLLSRADHRLPVRCLDAAFRAVSAQGSPDCSYHRTQRRAALTRWQCFRWSASISGRSDRRPSTMFCASSIPWWTPTSLSSSRSARSGTDTRTPSG